VARIIITPKAGADLQEIYAYLAAEAGVATAARYRQRFDELYRHLALYPESCPRRPKLNPTARIGIVSPYVVLYAHPTADDTATIVRVVHGSRRITRKLLREEKK